MAERDSVFHRYTAYLARRAGGIVIRWTLAGGVLGGLLGSVTLTHWATWPVSHRQAYLVAALGVVCGAFLGRALGSGRAQMTLFQAQLAQHQLEFERRLLAVGAAVAAQPQQQSQPEPEPQPQTAVESEVAPQPEPVSEPVPVPAPVAAPEPEPAPQPVYLSDPPLALGGQEFAVPSLPEPAPEPEPQPVAEPEPAAFEPAQVVPAPTLQPAPPPYVPEPAAAVEHQPADVVPFVPRPEPGSEPAPAAVAPFHIPSAAPRTDTLPTLSYAAPPLSSELPAAPGSALPATHAEESEPNGYGWQRPGVIDQ
jgi:hypothetical protein